MYPPEMAVTGRYRGQGQVAQAGFRNPQWVEGELLVFAAAANPAHSFVRGAQLGFTFDVRANQRCVGVGASAAVVWSAGCLRALCFRQSSLAAALLRRACYAPGT